METLEIVIGLIFIFLILSLLATTIQEIIAGLFSMRGRVLLRAIAKLVEVENLDAVTNKSRAELLAEFKEKVKQSKVYRNFSSHFWGMDKYPSYLSSTQVAEIIADIFKSEAPEEEENQIVARGLGPKEPEKPQVMKQMKRVRLKNQLNLIVYGEDENEPQIQTRGLAESAQKAVEERIKEAEQDFKVYYNEMMDRASGWYKRNVQLSLIIIGLVIGFAFDADTFKIYTNLTQNPDDRKELIELAVNFADENRIEQYQNFDTTNRSNLDTAAQLAQVLELKGILDTLLINEINQVPAPLGLGRPEGFFINPPDELKSYSGNWFWWHIKKLLGWIVTALAISMGAPFWFDLLKKFVHIRNAGLIPGGEEKKA